MLQGKDVKKIQELKADYTPLEVLRRRHFQPLQALKLSEGLSDFKWFKQRGYDFQMVPAILVSMVVSPDKTVNPPS